MNMKPSTLVGVQIAGKVLGAFILNGPPNDRRALLLEKAPSIVPISAATPITISYGRKYGILFSDAAANEIDPVKLRSTPGCLIASVPALYITCVAEDGNIGWFQINTGNIFTRLPERDEKLTFARWALVESATSLAPSYYFFAAERAIFPESIQNPATPMLAIEPWRAMPIFFPQL